MNENNENENEGFFVGQMIEIHSFPPGHCFEEWNGCMAKIHHIKTEERKLALGESWFHDVSFDHCRPLS